MGTKELGATSQAHTSVLFESISGVARGNLPHLRGKERDIDGNNP